MVEDASRNVPLLTSEIVRRLEAAAAYNTQSRMEGLQKLENNLYQVEKGEFGNISAWRSANLPYPFFNRVFGLDAAHLSKLPEVLEWYKSYNYPCRIELASPFSSDEFLQQLAQAGFYQAGFLNTFYGLPLKEKPRLPMGVEVRRLEPDEMPLFSQVYNEGNEYKGSRLAEVRRMVEMEHSAPDYQLYLATVDQQPAAVAALIRHKGIAYLGTMATIPAMRGRGCQAALLQQRLFDTADCDLVMTVTQPGTVSDRNVRRAGFQLAYAGVYWLFLHHR